MSEALPAAMRVKQAIADTRADHANKRKAVESDDNNDNDHYDDDDSPEQPTKKAKPTPLRRSTNIPPKATIDRYLAASKSELDDKRSERERIEQALDNLKPPGPRPLPGYDYYIQSRIEDDPTLDDPDLNEAELDKLRFKEWAVLTQSQREHIEARQQKLIDRWDAASTEYKRQRDHLVQQLRQLEPVVPTYSAPPQRKAAAKASTRTVAAPVKPAPKTTSARATSAKSSSAKPARARSAPAKSSSPKLSNRSNKQSNKQDFDHTDFWASDFFTSFPNLAEATDEDQSRTVVFPASRMENIAKMVDPNIKLSSEALGTMSKACETFIRWLGLSTSVITSEAKSALIKPEHLVKLIESEPKLFWLRWAFHGEPIMQNQPSKRGGRKKASQDANDENQTTMEDYTKVDDAEEGDEVAAGQSADDMEDELNFDQPSNQSNNRKSMNETMSDQDQDDEDQADSQVDESNAQDEEGHANKEWNVEYDESDGEAEADESNAQQRNSSEEDEVLID